MGRAKAIVFMSCVFYVFSALPHLGMITMSETEDWVKNYQKSAEIDKEKEIGQLSEEMREDDLLFKAVSRYGRAAKKE